ncbi:hypothetical protein Ocin01_14683 [Orchesella cincta]|uniref:Uncharacterized protein n=1 Tax=Orchesella cincta TaxID=48709 RepID=A0A1D2MGK3_ORCCI|nr:hypothetical protein Ocin01_14683 [Orchesella cincta]
MGTRERYSSLAQASFEVTLPPSQRLLFGVAVFGLCTLNSHGHREINRFTIYDAMAWNMRKTMKYGDIIADHEGMHMNNLNAICRVFLGPLLWWHEILIPLRYALFPAFLSIFLSFIDWHPTIVFVLLLLFVFLRIVQKEDKQIGRFKIQYVFLKLVIAIVMFLVTEWAAATLEAEYLPPGVVPSSTLAPPPPPPELQKKTMRIRMSKSKAKYYLNPHYELTYSENLKMTMMRIVVEYLYFASFISHYRWMFLGIIFTVYGVLYAILWLSFSNTDEDGDGNANEEEEIIDDIHHNHRLRF